MIDHAYANLWGCIREIRIGDNLDKLKRGRCLVSCEIRRFQIDALHLFGNVMHSGSQLKRGACAWGMWPLIPGGGEFAACSGSTEQSSW